MTPPVGAECTVDSDCKDGQNGLCVRASPNVGDCTVCSYDECFADADCKTGGPCDCRASRVGRNTCRAGNCRIDGDCGPGGYCSLSPGPCPGYDEYSAWAVGYFCRTPKDTCREDTDCAKPGYIEQCRYDQAAAAWRCFDWPGCPV